MSYNEMMIDDLLHKIEIQNQKIGDMDKEIERLHKVFDIKDEARCELVKENKELQRIVNDLHSELAGATNDYKQASNEIKLLNNQIGNLQRNVGYLCEENRKLRDTINAYEQLF